MIIYIPDAWPKPYSKWFFLSMEGLLTNVVVNIASPPPLVTVTPDMDIQLGHCRMECRWTASSCYTTAQLNQWGSVTRVTTQSLTIYKLADFAYVIFVEPVTGKNLFIGLIGLPCIFLLNGGPWDGNTYVNTYRPTGMCRGKFDEKPYNRCFLLTLNNYNYLIILASIYTHLTGLRALPSWARVPVIYTLSFSQTDAPLSWPIPSSLCSFLCAGCKGIPEITHAQLHTAAHHSRTIIYPQTTLRTTPFQNHCRRSSPSPQVWAEQLEPLACNFILFSLLFGAPLVAERPVWFDR